MGKWRIPGLFRTGQDRAEWYHSASNPVGDAISFKNESQKKGLAARRTAADPVGVGGFVHPNARRADFFPNSFSIFLSILPKDRMLVLGSPNRKP